MGGLISEQWLEWLNRISGVSSAQAYALVLVAIGVVFLAFGLLSFFLAPLFRSRPVALPQLSESAPAEEPAPPPAPVLPAVLVVDDSAVVRVKLRRLLESAGYRVELASDGAEAERVLEKTRFDVLITDLEMPEVDGFQLIASVLGSIETENMPIIAITGHEDLHARVQDCGGVFGIFHKPWNDRELLRRVAALVQLRETVRLTPRFDADPV